MFKFLLLLSLEFMFHNQTVLQQTTEIPLENHELIVEEFDEESVSTCADLGPDINLEPDPNPETDTYSLR